jgi:cysteinyl-tRNA synthetase
MLGHGGQYLGESFDIHGGGIDLIFPHHENEIAQSCCTFGDGQPGFRMARHWMHNGFLTVAGAKMSKSLGNFTTVTDLLQKWHGEVIRLALLMTHYTRAARPVGGPAEGSQVAARYLAPRLGRSARTALPPRAPPSSPRSRRFWATT